MDQITRFSGMKLGFVKLEVIGPANNQQKIKGKMSQATS